MPPMAYFYSVNYDWATLGIYNGAYTLKLRLQVTGGSWEEYTRSVTVNNLSFGNANTEIIKWLDDTTQTSTSISVPIYGKALDNVNITATLNIYDCASATDSQTGTPVLVRSIQQTIANPDTVTFTWDGKDNSGNAVHRGLYSFDIVASRMQAGSPPGDTIKYRSETLNVLRGVDGNGQQIYDVEYIGDDDNGTPTDDTDDKVLYVVRAYIVKDLLAVSAGTSSKIVLYDPHLNTKGEWNINTLKCREHNDTMDGCTTNSNGIMHEVIVPVPAGTFAELGHYRFVVDMIDNNSAVQRCHQNRKALQINGIFDHQAIEWLTIGGGWGGAWCKADYMDKITKKWRISEYPHQCADVADPYEHPEEGKIRVAMNGGYFDNNGINLKYTYTGVSEPKGAVKTIDKNHVQIGHTILGNKFMREGVVAFNLTGSDFKVAVLDHGYKNNGINVFDPPYNTSSDTEARNQNKYYKPYTKPGKPYELLSETMSMYHHAKDEKHKKIEHDKISEIFGSYHSGKIGDWIIINNTTILPHVDAGDTAEKAYRSVLVIGKERTAAKSKKSGKDMFLLTCSVDKTVDDIRIFLTTATAGGFRYWLHQNHKISNFVVESAILVDGGYSSQVYLGMKDNSLRKWSNIYGIYRYYNGRGGVVTSTSATSIRPIPDYIYAEADYVEVEE